ncbi:MAG: DUF4347 domain-containing protein [Alcanivoracaceae bacterium]
MANQHLSSLFRNLLRSAESMVSAAPPVPEDRAARAASARSLEPRILLDAAAMETLERTLEPLDWSSVGDDDGSVKLLEAFTSQAIVGSAQLVIIDESVVGWRDLVDQLDDNVSVEFIRADADGMVQLADILAGYSDLKALHLISHGSDGLLRLGNTSVTRAELSLYQDVFASIRTAFAEGADWFIYGCDLAASAEGRAFVDALAELAGVDVAASDDTTGDASLGGNWVLEYTAGEVEIGSVLEFGYAGTLAWIDVGQDGGTVSGEWVGADIAADGRWIVAGTYVDQVHIYQVVGPNRVLFQTITTSAAAATAGSNGHSVDISGDYLIFGDRAAANFQIWKWNAAANAWQLNTSWNQGTAGQYSDVAIYHGGGARIWAGSSNVTDTSGGTGVVIFRTSSNSGTSWATAGAAISFAGRFGRSIAIADNIALVGRPDDSSNRGTVHRYSLADSGASQLATHAPANRGHTSHNPGFGWSVDADYDGTNVYWVAGGPRSYTPSGWFAPPDRHGYVDVYTGTQGQTVTANIRGESLVGGTDEFGRSVAIAARGGGQASIIVGAPSGHGNSGWAFRFDNVVGRGLIGSANAQYGPVGSSSERMGWSMAMTRHFLVVGAPTSSAVAPTAGRFITWFDYNGGPTAVADSVATNQNTPITINALANDTISNDRIVNPVSVFAFLDNRGGSVNVTNALTPQIVFDPLTDFRYLGVGQNMLSNSADGLGTIKITYEIIDAFGNASTAVISVNVTGLNDAPVVNQGIADRTGMNSDNALTPVSFSIPTSAFFDVDQSDVLQYFLTGLVQIAGGAQALAVNVTTGGVISYTPELRHWDTRYQVTIEARDPHGASAFHTFIINIDRPNRAPTVDAVPVSLEVWQQNLTPEGQSTSFPYNMSQHFDDLDLYESDPRYSSEALRYTIVSGQTWLTVGSFDGVMRGNPLNQHVGVHNVTVRATDEFGRFVEKTIQITVRNVNDAPIITGSVDRQIAYIGQAYSLTLPVNLFDDIDNPKDTITLSAFFADGTPVGDLSYSGPGAWLRFNPATRQFTSSGTVTGSIGSQVQVYVRATDNGTTAGQPDPRFTDYYFNIDIFPVPAVAEAAFGPVAGYDFGRATAISENGEFWVVAAPGFPSNTNAGAVHIYRWNGTEWVGSTFTAIDGAVAGDRASFSVAISSDGQRIAFGAPGWNEERGRVTLYQWNGTNHVFQRHISGVNPGDNFGFAVALNQTGSRIVIGAPGVDTVATNAGAAYYYSWTGALEDTILPTALPGGTVQFGWFGASVAYDRNVALIGAPYESHSGRAFAGTVTVVRANETAGFGDRKKFHMGTASKEGDLFGWSVAVDVFRGIGTAGVNNSVVFAVGAPGADVAGANQGAVHVYRSDLLTTTVTAAQLETINYLGRVTAYDEADGSMFGISVALDVDGLTDVESGNGLRLVVGGDVSAGGGALYAYRWWDSHGFVGQRFNHAASPTAGSQYGWAVGISGTRFVGGAPGANSFFSGRTTQAGSLVESTPFTGVAGKKMELIADFVMPVLPPALMPVVEAAMPGQSLASRSLDDEWQRKRVVLSADINLDAEVTRQQGDPAAGRYAVLAGSSEIVITPEMLVQYDDGADSQPDAEVLFDGEQIEEVVPESADGFSGQLDAVAQRYHASSSELLFALENNSATPR